RCVPARARQSNRSPVPAAAAARAAHRQARRDGARDRRADGPHPQPCRRRGGQGAGSHRPGDPFGSDGQNPAVTATAWLSVAVFAVAYLLIATEWVHRVKAALGGAVILLVLGATDAETA